MPVSPCFLVFFLVAATAAQLSLSVVNHLSGTTPTYAYVTARSLGNQIIVLRADQTWSSLQDAVTASVSRDLSESMAIPLAADGARTAITIPGEFTSGRIWCSSGALAFGGAFDSSGQLVLVEPSVVNATGPNDLAHWGFVELSYTAETGLFVNLSYVDFVGLALGISLESQDGQIQAVAGVPVTAPTDLCDHLRQHARRSGDPWDQLCVSDPDGCIRRVLSPSSHIRMNPAAFRDYYADYVDEVWSVYSQRPLVVDSHLLANRVTCIVLGDTLSCSGDDRGFGKPSAADIFRCDSGPFAIHDTDAGIRAAIVPRLCAAFHRATLLLAGGDLQPGLDPSFYYTADPHNVYSQLVHALELDGKGYAFPYDDVGPDQSGILASHAPRLLTITVGGPSSSTGPLPM